MKTPLKKTTKAEKIWIGLEEKSVTKYLKVKFELGKLFLVNIDIPMSRNIE